MTALPIPDATICGAPAIETPSRRDPFVGGAHATCGAHADIGAVGILLDPGQHANDVHAALAGVDPSETADQSVVDTQSSTVGGPVSPPVESICQALPTATPVRLEDSLLLIYSDALTDLEKTRIASENRVRALLQGKGSVEGDAPGKGEKLDDLVSVSLSVMPKSPERKGLERLWGIVLGLRAQEHEAALLLAGALRKHPFGPWMAAQKGIGEKQGARLLAAIGDPYWNHADDRPRRGPAELWAYCGYHVFDGTAARRAKGQRANWSSEAKMRAFLVAESCMKAGGPYRDVYDRRKASTENKSHDRECKPCHAQTGDPWKDGHRHADALRITAKEILKDLWREAKRLHEEDQ